LTKAFDRLFDTGRVFYFIGDLRVKTADIDALLEKYEEFFNGEILKIKNTCVTYLKETKKSRYKRP
jgi:ABC-2 type transport system ATP-binding protein